MSTDSSRAAVFSRNVRRLLERDWLNQREAAERIGVPYKWVRRLCHQGLERLDRRTEADLKKVAQHFGLRVADLWHEEVAARLTPPRRQSLVKWTGSKRRQAAEIVWRFPKRIATYFEPFVGGGSVLYRLLESGIPVERFRCSDTCRPLIGLWRLVKGDPRQIVEVYEEMWHRLGEKGARYYHSIRDDFNESGDPLLFFFLLRTCRIGLVRFNSNGEFTSAYHHGSRGMTPDRVKGIVEDWSGKLRQHDVRFYVRDYRRIQSSQGDLLYLDPPYRASHQSRIYGKWIDFAQFFRWLRRQQGDYLFSLDGFVEEEDRRIEVPDELYAEHLLLPNGMASLPRINGAKAQSVRDSLYVRVRSPRRDRTAKKWEKVLSGLDRYCGERFIDVPKPEWTILADAARSDEAHMASIARELARVCGRFAPPCPQCSETQRRSDFRRLLDSEDERVEVETDLEVGGLPIASEASKWSRLGCRFLNSWFLEIRNSGSHRSSPSLNEAWADPVWRASILRTALLLRDHLNEVTAHAAASMRLHIPTMFRPMAARSICNDFGNGGTVLDFSAGYGGNLLGFLGSRCQRYVGIDPNAALRPSYEQMFDWIKRHHRHGKTWKMVWEPAEDVDFSPWRGEVDLIFTSPPYFDLQRYSDQPTQSWKRYGSIERWLDGFLFRTLRNMKPCVKRGGYFALNVADNETFGIRVIDRLVEFCTKRLGLRLMKVIPYLLAGRPGASLKGKRVGWGQKAEPVFVFQRR